jgi:hypothetical protein
MFTNQTEFLPTLEAEWGLRAVPFEQRGQIAFTETT